MGERKTRGGVNVSGRIMKFCKGMLIGLVVGAVGGAVGICCLKGSKKGLKRSIGKALRSVGDVVDNVTEMF